MEKELKLKLLEAKKLRYKLAIDNIDKQIEKLTNEIYCIVCANRIPEHDFKIPDGIVCGHPSNQECKDKFRCYSHTCKYWKQEKR